MTSHQGSTAHLDRIDIVYGGGQDVLGASNRQPGWPLLVLRALAARVTHLEPPGAVAPPLTRAVEVPGLDPQQADGNSPSEARCAQLRVTVRCRETAGHPYGHVYVHASAAPDRKAG